ncbi:FAD-dependent oxidoreductase [Dehalobacter sp. DCM]|uniref:oxidoreductase n=1 Tax=Dehalobacter sp. DCM TaxID=2907827 RepID=UPI003081E0A4|nr:FAD-dependent oxidoreductase [Dehalobacter sp. DCM]
MYPNLFATGKIGTLDLKNRIVMTPMGNALSNTDGTVSEELIAFYAARAKGGVGLIFTEVARINDENGVANRHQMSAASDKHIPGLKKLAAAVHENGGKIIVQINHPGRQGITALNGNKPMLAPSDVPCRMVQQDTHPMTISEVEAVIRDFVAAAWRIQQAGIDGVELHGAHGYLINQFLSPYTNKRTDQYGGNLENRMRFLEEIVLGVRAKCGKDFPLIVRLSVDEILNYAGVQDTGLTLDEGVRIAERMEQLGVDAIDVSSGIYETMNVAWEPSSFAQGWKLHLSEAVKKAVKIPVIGVSVIREAAFADKIIGEGIMDFAGSARQHFADSEWAIKAQENRAHEARLCISCLHCMESLTKADMTGEPAECAVNAMAGRELKYSDIKEDGAGRVVVVIGAGPAGLEAARVLAMRKFKPIVFEKSSQVGGQLELANKPPFKDKITWLINYLKIQAEKLGIEIRLNTAPTVEAIKTLNPYAVFVAQGSKPILPGAITGLDGKNVFTPPDILTGKVQLYNQNIAVVGSGMTGLETADLLAEKGNKVTVFEMADNIGPDLFFQNLIDIMMRLGKAKVPTLAKHKLVKIDGSIATFELLAEGKTQEFEFDYFVVSLGMRANTQFVEEIVRNFERVRVIGDADKPGRIRSAIAGGFDSAYLL